jgi:RHS repeat-associated protein
MIAGKWFDPCIGIDIHLVIVPPSPSPVPLPHPFIGLVFDPAGLIVGAAIGGAIAAATGSAFKGPVVVNSLPCAHTGLQTTNKMTMPHIPTPPGVSFAKGLPANDGTIVTGSKTVYFSGSNAVRLGDLVMTCGEPIRLPSSTIIAIPMGLPVLVGGPPTLDVMAALLASIRTQWVSEQLHSLLGATEGSWTSKIICFLTGHPVDVVSGMVLTSCVDFKLPGPIPFHFERNYYSRSNYRGPLGCGWHHSYDQYIRIDKTRIVLRAEDGRELYFPLVQQGESSRNYSARLKLTRSVNGFQVTNSSKLRLFFGPAGRANGTLPLLRIEDVHGNRVALKYDLHGHLIQIIDSAGRDLRLQNDVQGRVLALNLPDAKSTGNRVDVARFAYDANGDLVAASDALGQAYRYSYKAHLLVQETDRTGVSFYFMYDGIDHDSRCVRTWGDGGIYDHVLSYDRQKRLTVVEDSLGHKTTYFANQAGLVVKIVDALGGVRTLEWNSYCRQTAETDADGQTTRFEYDNQGWLIARVDPLGNRHECAFDAAGNVVRLTNQAGHTMRREFDGSGNLLSVIDRKGGRWSYQCHRRGLVGTITDPLGRHIHLDWDSQGNVQRVLDRTGGQTSYEFDGLGQLVLRVDALGRRLELSRDSCGRITRVNRAGRIWRFQYDAAGNLVEAVDPLGRTHRYCYGPLGKLIESETPSGARSSYRYNTEGKLIAVKDARGREWTLERDALGNIIAERTFDGRQFRYEYDPTGRLIAVTDPQGQPTRLARDAAGRLVRRTYHDGTQEEFAYDPRGYMVKAESASAVVMREYDADGRIMMESVAGRTLRNSYDSVGNRIARTSPFGRTLRSTYDAEGRLESVSEAAGTLLKMRYDPAGQEVERILPGGVSRVRQYAPTGELLAAQIDGRVEGTLVTTYRYDPDGQLERIDDSDDGVTGFEHNPDGRLVAVTYPDQSIDRYFYDAAGNVPGVPDWPPSPEQTGYSGQVDCWRLLYDASGRLIEKASPARKYSYKYDGAGRLARVSRYETTVEQLPGSSGSASLMIEFGYDALGRRVWKDVKNPGSQPVRVEFLWDGDVLLGERRQAGDNAAATPGQECEYFFRPGTFEPLLQLGEGGDCLIECDDLGTPRAALDRRGRVVWKAQYRGFGDIRQEFGRAGTIPFRFPGQYSDVETGLCYNFFRYYDPEVQRYTTPDPLGLAGGKEPWNYVRSPVRWTDPYGLVDPWDILFSQNNFSPVFANGPWAGRTLAEAIAEARSLGRLPEGLELNAMLLNDQWVALNNRTLYVAQQANLPNVNPNDVGPSGLNELNNKLKESDLPGPIEDAKPRGCS